jgi:hypothetical protein
MHTSRILLTVGSWGVYERRSSRYILSSLWWARLHGRDSRRPDRGGGTCRVELQGWTPADRHGADAGRGLRRVRHDPEALCGECESSLGNAVGVQQFWGDKSPTLPGSSSDARWTDIETSVSLAAGYRRSVLRGEQLKSACFLGRRSLAGSPATITLFMENIGSCRQVKFVGGVPGMRACWCWWFRRSWAC